MKKSACNELEEYESEKRYQTIFNIVPISILEYDFSDSFRFLKELENKKIEDYNKYFEKNPNILKKIISSVKLVNVNEEAIKLYGAANKEELIGNLGKHTTPESFETFSKVIEEYLKGKIYYECETVNKTLDGRLIDIILRVTFPGEKQLSKRAIVSVTDITEREKAEKLLRNSEAQYRTTIDSLGDAIHVVDTDLRIILTNLALREFIKGSVPDTEVTGQKLFKAFPFLSDDVLDEYQQVFNSGKTLITTDSTDIGGRVFITETRKIPIKEEGKTTRILTVIRDITERKQAEGALHESEERYRMIFDYVPVSIFEYECKDALALQNELKAKSIKDYKIYFDEHPEILTRIINQIQLTDVNEETIELYKARTKQEFFEQYGRNHIPETIETFRNTISAFTEGEKSFECETVNRTLGGKLINILYRATFPSDEHLSTKTLVTVVDITQRKQERERLQQRTRAVEASMDGMAVLNANEEYIYLNEAHAKVYGYDNPDELIGKTWRVLYYDDEIERFEKEIVPGLFEKGSWRGEAVGKKKDGSTYPQEVSLTALEEGGLICVVRDITERKSAEDALRKSEAHLRDFLENVNELVQSVAPDGSFIYVNNAWKKTLGYTDDEISGITLFDIIHPDNLEHCKELFQRVMSGETVSNIEAVFVAKDGREILVEGNANCNIEDGKPVSTRGIFHDVTEKKRMEEERIKISNLDSLGILAGGIAHDFNNILTAILGNISLAKMFLKPNNKIYSRLTKSENACFRAQDLTYQLLTFSRGGAPIRETASIREIIQDSANFSLIGSNVRCEFSFADNLLPVQVDKGQISQVINNLIINADQAMPDGGVIEVKVENVSSRSVDILPLKPEKFVEISMKDSGIGIPEEYISRLFDPYFTTKQKGSGLGLATAYAIIKKHDGYITVDSKVGAGTTFNIFLPVPSEYINIKETVKKKPIDIPEKKAKILLMDDDPEVRNVVIAMLKFLGHESEVTCDGAEALEIYKKAKVSGEPFEVVMMDLTVPGGMGGKEAMEKLLEIDPEVKAIVSSGYSNDPVLSDFKKYGFKGLISKPYMLEELREVLNEVMS